MQLLGIVKGIANSPLVGASTSAVSKRAEISGTLHGFKKGFILGVATTALVAGGVFVFMKTAGDVLCPFHGCDAKDER